MCHQTVGLIARQAEAAGIATLSMSSARDITAAVNPPRAVFLDWPLGHTAGRPQQPVQNAAVMRATLTAFETAATPGTIVDLDVPWADDDDWKDLVMRPRPSSGSSAASETAADERIARSPTPQYQTAIDATAAATHHAGQECLVCAGIDY